jgi:hypothetical protein
VLSTKDANSNSFANHGRVHGTAGFTVSQASLLCDGLPTNAERLELYGLEITRLAAMNDPKLGVLIDNPMCARLKSQETAI